MKASYFGYAIEKHSTQETFLHDLRGFLRCFAGYNNAEYKAQFTHLGENVYVVHVRGDVFLFLITRNHEIIKRINSRDLSVTEIQDLLLDDSIGFASYLYMQSSYFAFASTAMAPRVPTFCEMVTRIFRTLQLNDYRIVPYPLITKSSRRDARRMNIIGETSMRLHKDSGLANHIKVALQISDAAFEEIGGIDIKFKPQRKRSITVAARQIIDQVPDAGLERFVVKAKNQVGETLQELWLVDKGQLSDSIGSSREIDILEEIPEKANNNGALHDKVSEHEASNEFSEVDHRDLDRFRDAESWADHLGDIPPPN